VIYRFETSYDCTDSRDAEGKRAEMERALQVAFHKPGLTVSLVETRSNGKKKAPRPLHQDS